MHRSMILRSTYDTFGENETFTVIADDGSRN